MFYKYILCSNLNKQIVFRPFRDFDKFNHSTTNFLSRPNLSKQCHQTQSYHNIGVTSKQFQNAQQVQRFKSNILTLRRIFCTKPKLPAKKGDRGWLSIRRQHLESKREIKRLFSLAKNEKWYLIGAIGCLCVSSSVTLGVPHAIGKIMDMIVMDTFPKEKLQVFCVVLFGIFIAGSLANFGRIYLMNSASKLKMLTFHPSPKRLL